MTTSTLTGRSAVRATLSEFISNPPIENVNQVFTSFPKNINYEVNAQAGQMTRSAVVVFRLCFVLSCLVWFFGSQDRIRTCNHVFGWILSTTFTNLRHLTDANILPSSRSFSLHPLRL